MASGLSYPIQWKTVAKQVHSCPNPESVDSAEQHMFDYLEGCKASRDVLSSAVMPAVFLHIKSDNRHVTPPATCCDTQLSVARQRFANNQL